MHSARVCWKLSYNMFEVDRMDSDFDFIFIIISFLAQNEIETKIF